MQRRDNFLKEKLDKTAITYYLPNCYARHLVNMCERRELESHRGFLRQFEYNIRNNTILRSRSIQIWKSRTGLLVQSCLRVWPRTGEMPLAQTDYRSYFCLRSLNYSKTHTHLPLQIHYKFLWRKEFVSLFLYILI